MEFLAFLMRLRSEITSNMQINFINTNSYSLIDWEKGNTLTESILLTSQEAHLLNQSFALNYTTKRYVKDYHIEDNSIEKHIQSNNIKQIIHNNNI